MTKNPFINALAATLYIIIVASTMRYGQKFADRPDTFLIPIAVLSLFTLSAAVMGCLFLYQPLRMYLDGEKQRAGSLFLQTVAVFAILTFLLFFMMFSGFFL